jgi:hypothetical protein
MLVVSDNKELASAIENGVSMICVEGSLADGVAKMKAVGPVAWIVAFSALSVGVAVLIVAVHAAAVTAPVGGVGGGVSFGALPSFGVVAGILGAKTAVVAFGIAVSAGGVGVLTKIREKYTIVEKSENRLVLKLKS